MADRSYIDIISIPRARYACRVDDSLDQNANTELESMVKAACQYVERFTNHILVPRTFRKYGCSIEVYDFPVISVESTVGTKVRKPLSTVYDAIEGDELVYKAGYEDIADIPEALIQAALQLVIFWYRDCDKLINENLIPYAINEALYPFKRFV